MPALAAHVAFAQCVLAQLPAPLRARIEPHRALFLWGSQGPDLLFYDKPWRSTPVSALGNELHAQSGAAFFARLPARDTHAPQTHAYLLGLCCHYALDCAVHPMVDALAPDNVSHRLLESALDRHFVTAAHLPARHKLLPLSGVDFSAIAAAYPELADPTVLARAARTMVLAHRVFNHRALLGLIDRAAGAEGAMAALAMPDAPHSDVQTLLPLFAAAASEACALLIAYDDPATPQHVLDALLSKNFSGETV